MVASVPSIVVQQVFSDWKASGAGVCTGDSTSAGGVQTPAEEPLQAQVVETVASVLYVSVWSM